MQRFLIKCINCIWLFLIFIAIPAITAARFGAMQVSSTPEKQTLTIWGLSLAAVGNAVGALALRKDRKTRTLCWLWAVAFGGLLGLEFALVRGYLNFNWLKQALLWLQKHL